MVRNPDADDRIDRERGVKGMIVTRSEKYFLLFIAALLATCGFIEGLTGFEFGVLD